jgi:hypothetical protein
MKVKRDPMFSDTKDMNVGDIIGFDPSKEGTGGYKEGVIATIYRFSLMLEDGNPIGVTRVLMHRRPTAATQTLPSAPPPEPLREKKWRLPFEQKVPTKKRYVSFPF